VGGVSIVYDNRVVNTTSSITISTCDLGNLLYITNSSITLPPCGNGVSGKILTTVNTSSGSITVSTSQSFISSTLKYDCFIGNGSTGSSGSSVSSITLSPNQMIQLQSGGSVEASTGVYFWVIICKG